MESIKWLSDNPIESEDEDSLAFGKVADVFSKMIIECDTPFTIGINGEWGSGKTSLMKLIKAKIETKINPDDQSKIRIAWFDTWNFANENEIWKLLMISLIEDLDKNNLQELDIEKLLSSVFDLGEIAVTAYTTGGISLYANRKNIIESTKNIFDAKRSKEEAILKNKIKSIKSFRQDFEKLISKSVGDKGRYIIFIDDLDRITPNKTIDVIEAVKTFLDCKNCVFIIGCDYNYLNACIEKKYSDLSFSSRDYIEKIVQITFEVSALNNHVFNIYLSKNITQFFTTRDDFKIASNLIDISLGRNPRKIKRLTNLFSIVHNLNDRGLDNCLLLKLICFMQRWPDTYKKSLADFNDNIYSFKKYQDWAFPIVSWYEFVGYDPSYEYEEEVDDYIPTEEEQYEEYKYTLSKTKSEVDEKLNKNNKYDVEINKMKIFLQAPPFFPHQPNDLAPYLSLVQSIDLGAVRLTERKALEGLPSIKEIFDLYEKIKLLFDGQEIDGKYFNSEDIVTLPKKEELEEFSKSFRLKNVLWGNVGKWFYRIIDSKSNDEKILKLIKDFRIEGYNAFWIISPWGFSKYVIKAAKEKTNIYLSSYSSLEDLYNVLNNKL